ncbi:RpiB/LacA/LacB family sugar-phosphate isomerase [Kitasatospora sp. NPDC059088]|uniref:RpiB/LacA/LacB family sugar-phosphate isomerase n=1 Tax=Kitasatospora sp. NPDC059088 TaxID=3346722 RepID=UPI0036B67FF8
MAGPDAGFRWRVAVACDKAGALHLAALTADLRASRLVEQVVEATQAPVPYPEAALAAAELVAAGHADRALLVCHTGLGVCVAANKVAGIRAVTAHDAYSVEHAIRYTDAQVLCLGQAIVPLDQARELVRLWLTLHFDPDTKAARRLAAIAAYEQRRSPTI